MCGGERRGVIKDIFWDSYGIAHFHQFKLLGYEQGTVSWCRGGEVGRALFRFTVSVNLQELGNRKKGLKEKNWPNSPALHGSASPKGLQIRWIRPAGNFPGVGGTSKLMLPALLGF